MYNNITDKELKMLEECQLAKDWANACDDIKSARGGEYPDDWWDKVNKSGMMDRIMSRWGANSKLTVKGFPNKDAMLQWLNRN